VSQTIFRVLLLQLGIAAVGSLGFYAFSDTKAALSALTGGLLCLVAGLPYSLRVASARTASPMQVLWIHGLGELSRVGITIGVMVVIFNRFQNEIAALPMLSTYIAATLSYWVALILSD
jgi:F0F1-type ATP synthase assembly protein I